MPNQQITIPYWLQIPQPIRDHLIKVFNIPRSEGSTIQSVMGIMSVTCDGHTHPDLLSISIPKMQIYLGSEEIDFWKLVELTLLKAEEESKPAEVTPAEQITCSICESTSQRHKKNCPKRD